MGRDGRRKESFQLGMALTARATLFAEGCRGSLSQAVMQHYGLRERVQAQPQTYALGIKEVWEVRWGRVGKIGWWWGGQGQRAACLPGPGRGTGQGGVPGLT